MRISSNPDDTHYHPYIGSCRIFLEGAQRSNVTLADEEGRFGEA